ncbi:TPA: TIGR01897 family CRISPR-associated protein [Candidatus Bathyarchaeota archaeon]|nr:TIGR01897 family CRISPR-associated protein [Candidatus Bathyarchaeota archaeon]
MLKSLRRAEEGKEGLEVYLDLTHGINYMSILTYRVVKEILEIFSIFDEVIFKAYNADPFSEFAEKLSINVIEDSKPTPTPFTEKAHNTKLKPLKGINLSPEESRKLFTEELKTSGKVKARELSALIGALYNGFPLALFRFYPEEKEILRKAVMEVLEVYEQYVRVSMEDGKLRVERRTKMDRDLKICAYSYVIATLLDELKLVSRRETEVPLNELIRLREELFKFDERLKARISRDLFHDYLKKLDDLKEKVPDWPDWIPFSKLEDKEECLPDPRNFHAHSGLEYCTVEVAKSGETFMVRYREDRIKNVANFCQAGLK